MANQETNAHQLARDILNQYRKAMHIDNEIRDAVIIKSVAMVALAYGLSITRDKALDVNDALQKLTDAERILARRNIEPKTTQDAR